MAIAYSVILVDADLFDRERRDSVNLAQRAADEQFERLAQDARMTLVTRHPEPRVMTVPELKQAFPDQDLRFVVGLYFTADIS